MKSQTEVKQAGLNLEAIYRKIGETYPELFRPYYGMVPGFQRLDWVVNYTEHCSECDGCAKCENAPYALRGPAFYNLHVLPLMDDMERYNAWMVQGYVGDHLWRNHAQHFDDTLSAALRDLVRDSWFTAGKTFDELIRDVRGRFTTVLSDVGYIPHEFRYPVYYKEPRPEVR